MFSLILFITISATDVFYYFFRCLAMTRQKFMITAIISAADCSPVFMINAADVVLFTRLRVIFE